MNAFNTDYFPLATTDFSQLLMHVSITQSVLNPSPVLAPHQFLSLCLNC